VHSRRLFGDSPAVTEIEALKAKLAAREGQQGFSENVAAIKARIAELESAGADLESANDDSE